MKTEKICLVPYKIDLKSLAHTFFLPSRTSVFAAVDMVNGEILK